MSASRSPYFHTLDLLRGAAAFLVTASHARNLFLADFSPTADRSPFWKALYFCTGLGHEAVIIFFVLSGCVVGRIVISKVEDRTWSWTGYLFDRVTRLWIVLLPALLLTLAWDALGARFAPQDSFIFKGNFAHIIDQPLSEKTSLAVFVGNALFLQGITVPTLGSNGPLWSLANEFWYYLIFPALFLSVYRRGRIMHTSLQVLFAVAALIFVGWSIAILFTVWLMGMLVFYLYRHLRHPSHGAATWGLLLSLVALVLALVASRVDLLSGKKSDLALGAVCAVFVYFALLVEPAVILSRVGGFFSSFSYSLYLLHLPFLVFIASILFKDNSARLVPTPFAFGVLVTVIVAVYAYSYVVFMGTEKRTAAVRSWLAARLGFAARASRG